MKQLLPIIYSAHHASHDFGEFGNRTCLNLNQRIRFSDYGSGETVPTNGVKTFVGERSRALGDLNRNKDHKNVFPTYDFATPPNNVWKDEQGLSQIEKDRLISRHESYYSAVLDTLKDSSETELFVIAWDNTAPYQIGRNMQGESITMPTIILSNFGDEGESSSLNEKVSCDPILIEILTDNFRSALSKAGFVPDVRMNTIFKGGHIVNYFSSLRNGEILQRNNISAKVQSLQIEYSTAITHDVETLVERPGACKLFKELAESVIEKSIESYFINTKRA